MCGIGVTTKKGLIGANRFAQRRGPDLTTTWTRDGIEFLHNLLHITGERTPQPLTDGDVACVYNGEIYNYRDFGAYPSDGFCILDLYRELGTGFARELDGEFAICIVDFRERQLVLAADTFACKPLWYEVRPDGFCAASYDSQLRSLGFRDGRKLKANTTEVYDLETMQLSATIQNRIFDLRQFKTSYDDWIEAFEASIEKRSKDTRVGIFIGLSSGYDSGAIACALDRQGTPFKAYCILNNENDEVLAQRTSRLESTESFILTADEFRAHKAELNDHCEAFSYYDGVAHYDIKNDQASVGLAAICTRAREQGRRIYLSGHGADEIISDYGFGGRKMFKHSGFGGLFPDRLEGFWPWHSFWDGTQIHYLNKEEYVAGHHGIEARYPFLDGDLVQEFLWLTAELKNKKYKSCLSEYLERRAFPFAEGEKRGFLVLDTRSKRAPRIAT